MGLSNTSQVLRKWQRAWAKPKEKTSLDGPYWSLNERGKAYYATQRYPEALKDFNDALWGSSKNEDIRNNRNQVLIAMNIPIEEYEKSHSNILYLVN